MRKKILPPLLLLPALAASLHAQDFDIQIDLSYIGNAGGGPITDNGGTSLTAGPSTANGDGAVVRVGYLEDVPLAKDPASFDTNDWNSFVPLTGDGLNFNPGRAIPNYSSIGDVDLPFSGPFGFFFFSTAYFASTDTNIPSIFPQRIAVRFYNGTTVAGSTHFTTVTSNNSEWELKLLPDVPLPGDESTLDLDAHSLTWQGAALKTDQLIGAAPVDLVLTDVSLLNPTTLQITWTGGSGNETIQTSTNGEDWDDGPTGQASPASITVDTSSPATLLVRVMEGP